MQRSFRDLLAWRQAMDLVKMVYFAVEAIPPEEREGLSAELRAGATAIPGLIARGYGIGTRRDFLVCLKQANHTLMELEERIRVAQGLGYFDQCTGDGLLAAAEQVGRSLQRLMRRLETGTRKPRK